MCLFVCEYMHMSAGASEARGVEFPGAGATDGYELPGVGAGN